MTELELAEEWLKYAKSDLSTAMHMFNDVNPKEIEITCYHSQQCAEKSLKAYLISKNIQPPYTHDLVELNLLCEAQEQSFSAINLQCISLTPYGVAVRYPNELAIDGTIAKMAIEKAQVIYDFCVEKIQKKDEETKDEEKERT